MSRMHGPTFPAKRTAKEIGEDISAAIRAFLEISPHLVQLVAEVDGVDVVAFQVREHDDLQQQCRSVPHTGIA